MTVAIEEMAVAVRGWAVPDDAKPPGEAFADFGPSPWVLVFDTETTLDTGQGLRVGCYQLRRNGRLREQAFFYAPEALTEGELGTLRAYCAQRGLRAPLTRAEFNDGVLLKTAWDRPGLIVGHNLPFDLSRVSIANAPAQPRAKMMRGGFSLTLSEDEHASHMQIKASNAGAAFVRLTIPSGQTMEARNRAKGGTMRNHHGYFLDTATLGGAMLGGRPPLGRLAELLGTKTRKGEAEHGEEITFAYLDYAARDVQVTWECWQQLHKRYAAYDLPTDPWQIHSEASIGKAHLTKMGLTPFQALNQWPDSVIATVMETYYGGRPECAIRRVPVPGVYVDFTSQYPTVFALQDLWRHLKTEHVNFTDEDPAIVQRLLETITVDDVLRRELWPQLDALVLIAADGDRLPTRARYADGNRAQRRAQQRGDRPRGNRTFNLGVSLRTGGPAQWYTLADAMASRLHTGKAPHVVRVLRFAAHGVQANLRPIDIAGDPAYRVDPRHEDPIRRLVELRASVRKQHKQAKADGDHERAATLDATQQAMKATANATSYGSAIEMNPVEYRKGIWVTIHHPDGTCHRARMDRAEHPGRWFHALVATLVSAGGRLLLAVAMRLLADEGGSYAFCDTDSLFIVATEHGEEIPYQRHGPHGVEDKATIHAISWQQVDALIARFGALNPYDPAVVPTILKTEAENFDPDTGQQREIECLAIATKRYSLFTRDSIARPVLVKAGDKRKRTEHGLGHLLPPNAPHPDLSDRAWLDEWWQTLLEDELGYAPPVPEWFAAPAVGRLTVTSPGDLRRFAVHNAARPYAAQVKPWGFLTIAHPTQHERIRDGGARTLVAPFERDPDRRLAMSWIDPDIPDTAPRPIRVTGRDAVHDASVAVLAYGDYYHQYRHHPEAKATDAADGQRCHPWTRGPLQPRYLRATELQRVGKESNRLAGSEQAPEDEDEVVIQYPAPRTCRGCNQLLQGRRQWCSDGCRKRFSRWSSAGGVPAAPGVAP